MPGFQKFMFDLSFDDAHRPLDPIPPPPSGGGAAAAAAAVAEAIQEIPAAPTFSEEELMQVREQAYESGYGDGKRAAETATARTVGTALAAVADRMKALDAQQAAANDVATRDAVKVAQAVVRKMLPQYAAAHGLAEIEAVVMECLSNVIDDPRVIIRVNDKISEALKAKIEPQAEALGFEGRLIVTGDAKIPPADCRLEWSGGGAERNQERLWAEIDAIVDRGVVEHDAGGGGSETATTATAP